MENHASGGGDVAASGLLLIERHVPSPSNLELIDKLTSDQLQLLSCQKLPISLTNIAKWPSRPPEEKGVC